MDSFKDSLAWWSTVLGIVLAILGVRLDSGWIALLGFLLIVGSSAVLIYALRERRRIKRASITIEGRRIDALNVANLARRMNRTLVVQEVDQVAIIKGDHITVEWRYAGFCRAPREAAVEFSIDMDTHIPFSRLDCVAYDLRNDPGTTHPIRPILIGSDGLSKKIAVPLLQPLFSQDPFSVRLICHMPGAMKSGIDYYASTLSVTQKRVQTWTVRLIFFGERPDWLRAYEGTESGAVKLLKEIRPWHENRRMTDYLDLATDVAADVARIYVFHRSNVRPVARRRATRESAARV